MIKKFYKSDIKSILILKPIHCNSFYVMFSITDVKFASIDSCIEFYLFIECFAGCSNHKLRQILLRFYGLNTNILRNKINVNKENVMFVRIETNKCNVKDWAPFESHSLSLDLY
jgi:hypothetical protein